MIDESGNLGKSETYFVLAMFNTTQRQKMKRILKKFQNNVDKNIIYNYFLSLIVVKVIKENMSQDKLVFHLDNHTIKVKSLNSFAEHIKLKAIENDYYDSKKHILIQYADIISNTVWNKFERKREHLYNESVK